MKVRERGSWNLVGVVRDLGGFGFCRCEKLFPGFSEFSRKVSQKNENWVWWV